MGAFFCWAAAVEAKRRRLTRRATPSLVGMIGLDRSCGRVVSEVLALGRGAVELVRFDQKRNFFELLRQKLRWGQPLTDAGA